MLHQQEPMRHAGDRAAGGAEVGTGLDFVVSAPLEPQFVVRADRPFALAIMHQPTGAPLVISHVADPLAR
jgi:hypothetical protein